MLNEEYGTMGRKFIDLHHAFIDVVSAQNDVCIRSLRPRAKRQICLQSRYTSWNLSGILRKSRSLWNTLQSVCDNSFTPDTVAKTCSDRGQMLLGDILAHLPN